MTGHAVGSREQWLEARLELLAAEKELTRQGDEIARRRQALPWVPVSQPYRFETESGTAALADLFAGRSQLLTYHFMFGPDYEAGCPSCSAIADGFQGVWRHLAAHDVTLLAVSRAPLSKLQAFRRRMGWTFPWVSSLDGSFNYDFNVSFSLAEQRAGEALYNYRRGGSGMDMTPPPAPVAECAAMCGTEAESYTLERPGMSAFVLDGGQVFHTYSAYARGLDALWGMFQWLDRAPMGRNETGVWWRRADEYAVPAPA